MQLALVPARYAFVPGFLNRRAPTAESTMFCMADSSPRVARIPHGNVTCSYLADASVTLMHRVLVYTDAAERREPVGTGGRPKGRVVAYDNSALGHSLRAGVRATTDLPSDARELVLSC